MIKEEKAILVAVRFPHEAPEYTQASLNELDELARTAGAVVINQIIQNRKEPDSAFFIGKGKVQEILSLYPGKDKPDLLIFNHDLSPTQIRNLEHELHIKVITRTELILDIFAIHASSRTAKLQVELAQLNYQLPRVIGGKGLEMSRLGGGIGTRGPGEKQLEIDRRLLEKRIHAIKEKLKGIVVERDVQRKNRVKQEFKIAIIGYTNSGKSTLLNRLTKANVLAEDKLFATLDTTTRKLWLGFGDGKSINVVITDTVGFIRDIPHSLIESFQSTLEDTLIADLLIHVLDATAPDFENKKKVVEATLAEIKAGAIPRLLCFNKIDNLSDRKLLDLRFQYPEAIFLSALKNLHMDLLKEKIRQYAMNSGLVTNQY